ncbi:MAG: hypothetical protein WC856_02235 [Methylococcaceae bacterium]
MDFSNAQLPSLKPLQNSFTVDEVENDLRNLFIDLFESLMASEAFDINVLGAAQLGSLELVRKMVNVDGLVFPDGDREETATRYLYKAWKSRNNQGRGFYFLQTYLQLLFPNASSVEQLAQAKAFTYPTSLINAVGSSVDTHYWTSRIRVTIDTSKTTWDLIDKMHPILLSIIPARFLLHLALLRVFNQRQYVGAALQTGSIVVIYPADSQLRILNNTTQYVGAALATISTVTIYPWA